MEILLIALDIIPRQSTSNKSNEFEKQEMRKLNFKTAIMLRQEIESLTDTTYDD